MWGPDAAPLPPNVALRWFSIAVAGFVSFGFVAKYALVADRPAIPREYPFSGLVTELGGLEENQVNLPFPMTIKTPAFGGLLPFPGSLL
jgi:NADH dehydrogenase (ubiquinone) 1 beta subcomplex subunit 8